MVIKAQRIECNDHAAFAMSFMVSYKGNSKATENFLFSQSKTIDLAATPFPEGVEIWPIVSALAGKTVGSKDHITFEMNHKTAVYQVSGTTLNYSVKFIELRDESGQSLQDFPPSIPIALVPFQNWAKSIDIKSIWMSAPRTANDVAEICNWAKDHNFTVRPSGIMHGWSPLSVNYGLSEKSPVLLADTTKSLHSMEMLLETATDPARVKVGTGATIGDLQAFLEKQPGGKGSASGFSFPHTPAPEHITIGGMIAINAHGTAVRTPPNDDFKASYGSISNNIVELNAIVTDPESSNPDRYQVRTFVRGEKDTKAFLTQLGSSLIVDVTLQVIDNYNLRCQSFIDIPSSILFASPKTATLPKKNFAEFLENSGRVEAIWFPFSKNPWLKVWTVEKEQPASSSLVNSPNNYPFSDNLEPKILEIVANVMGNFPFMTPEFGRLMEKSSRLGLEGKNLLGIKVYPSSNDIWGSSKNTLFYIKDSTLQVTANGYAVHMKKESVQEAVSDFANQFSNMLKDYQSKYQFPVNGPLEIRVTNLDDSSNTDSYNRPVISSLAVNAQTKANGWNVAVWFDVLSLPGTTHSNQFYHELETWLVNHFTGMKGQVFPEWSKGWAYDSYKGPWTDSVFMNHIREVFSTNRSSDDNWAYEVATLRKYDKFGIFASMLLNDLFEYPNYDGGYGCDNEHDRSDTNKACAILGQDQAQHGEL